MSQITIFLLSGAVLAMAAGWLLYKDKRPWRILAACLLWGFFLLLLAGGGYSCWYHHRPVPGPTEERLFNGITYLREVYTSPRPMIIHIVKVELDTPGIRFLVTPGKSIAGRQLPARTTSQFVKEFDVQLAINASFFEPFYVHWPRYYPHVGDPVDVLGLTISQGHPYSSEKPGYIPLYLSQNNQASIGQPIGTPYNVISGYWIFLQNGNIQPLAGKIYHPATPGPRTAVALDKTGRQLSVFVVDGRQPNYSEGITLPELGCIALQHGAYTALNLDGGGSTTLVKKDLDGNAVVLNSPVHLRIPPGRERPVANHLGIFADPLS